MIRAIKSARAAESQLHDDDLLSLVGDNTGVSPRLLSSAVRYWAAYPEEIDAAISAAEAARKPLSRHGCVSVA